MRETGATASPGLRDKDRFSVPGSQRGDVVWGMAVTERDAVLFLCLLWVPLKGSKHRALQCHLCSSV